jgi:hypothetical protein
MLTLGMERTSYRFVKSEVPITLDTSKELPLGYML